MVIDINTSLGHWPFQSLGAETPARLTAILKSAGITTALVSSIDAVLLPSPDRENERLARLLRGSRRLIPVPVVNPLLPQWPEAARACGPLAPAVKVYPNYHGYRLAEPCVAELMGLLARERMGLILPLRIEDERSHYPLMKVPAVPVADILELARSLPGVNVLCCCPYRQEAAALLKGPPNVYVDISMIDGLDPVRVLTKQGPASRILFGSHTPFLAAPAAVLKVRESDIPPADRRAIFAASARRALRLPSASRRT